MRNLAFLAVLTISAMALAGCSGDGGGDGDGTSSSSSSSRSTSSASSTSRSSSSSSSSASTTSTGPEANQAPTGSISVSVNGTNATFSLTGSDPDGDIVVWELDFGDGSSTNGTALPAEATHAYAGAGNFTANYTITDGTEPVTYDVAVTIAGAAAGAGPQVVEGEWVVGMVGCPQIMAGTFDPYPAEAADGEGVTHVKFDVDPVTIGTMFMLDVTFAGQAYLHEIDFYGADNAVIEYFPETDPTTPSDHTEGEVPSGSVFAVVYPCHPAPGSFTYTAG